MNFLTSVLCVSSEGNSEYNVLVGNFRMYDPCLIMRVDVNKIVINHFNKAVLILALRIKCSLIIGLLGIRIVLMNTYMGRKHSCPL